MGECLKDAPDMSNSIHINLTGNEFRPDYLLPTDEEVSSFQNRLFSYRLLNHDKLAAPNLDVSEFRPEICVMSDVLAAPLSMIRSCKVESLSC